MDDSLNVWIPHLRRRFQEDLIQAEDEADARVFIFANEKEFDLRTYITRKIVLLREAGYEDDYRLFTKLWRGLDPKLMNAVRVTRRTRSIIPLRSCTSRSTLLGKNSSR